MILTILMKTGVLKSAKLKIIGHALKSLLFAKEIKLIKILLLVHKRMLSKL